MSIFPQFIDPNVDYVSQVSLLAVTFSVLVLVIHTIYAVFASYAKSKLKFLGGRLLSRISGGLLISFGVGLAASNK